MSRRIELTTEDRERFEAKVDRSGGPDACHPWMASCNGFGYGHLWVDGRTEKAHRVAWCLAGNEITPEKPCILHNCPGGDEPACVNPDHLWSGTQADNNRDKARKRRGTKSGRGLPFGVTFARSGRFSAIVSVNGKMTYLGTYDTPEGANAAALAKKEELLDIRTRLEQERPHENAE